MLTIKNRKTLLLNLLLLVAVLVLLNLVSNALYTRADLTSGQAYKLTDLSRETVSELDDRLVVTAYFTRNLPPQEDTVRDYALDLLSEYSAASKGRVVVRVVNPSDRIESVEDANKHGVPHFTARYFEDDKEIEKEVFMGLVLSYANHEETIPVIRETRGLEYELTLRVRRLLDKERSKIAWVRPLRQRLREIRPTYDNEMLNNVMREMSTDPMLDQQIREELSRKDPLKVIKKRIDLVYELSEIDLWKPVDPDIDCLIVSAITDSLSQLQLYHLDQFFMRGGSLLVFQDRVIPYREALYPLPSNLFRLLDHWGMTLSEGFVLDENCMPHPDNRAKMMYEIVRVEDFNQDSPITQDLLRMYLNFCSPIDTMMVNEGVEITPLMFSSNQSIYVTGEGMQQRMYAFSMGNYLHEDPKTLAALYEGRFTSWFNDHGDAGVRTVLPENPHGRAILVGDTDCPEYSDKATFLMTPNEIFVLNALDYLHDNLDLITLRARRTAHSPLTWARFFPVQFDTVEEMMYTAERIRAWKGAVKWINILLPVLLLLIWGFVHWRREVNRRKKLSQIYK